jgi:hypothetical protein
VPRQESQSDAGPVSRAKILGSVLRNKISRNRHIPVRKIAGAAKLTNKIVDIIYRDYHYKVIATTGRFKDAAAKERGLP